MKSRNKTKVAAFTIVELIVTMLIGAIVISAGYTLLSMINNGYSSFYKNQKKISDFILLNSLVETDFDKADLIYQNTNNLRFVRDRRSVEYTFNKSEVIRKDSILTDTFHFGASKINAAFRGQEVSGAKIKLIDQFSVDIGVNGRLIPCQYKKIYSSETLFKLEKNAVN